MDATTALLAGNAAVWLALAGYVAFLVRSQRSLSHHLQRLEQLHGSEKEDR